MLGGFSLELLAGRRRRGVRRALGKWLAKRQQGSTKIEQVKDEL